MSTLFFIHLPKTGGTSLRYAARQYFAPERMLMLYGRRSRWTSPAAAAIVYESQGLSAARKVAALSDYLVANDIALFASHLSAVRLPCFDPARAFTILRHPVERVLSDYFFLRRKERTADPLELFIERPSNLNVQASKLGDVPLQALGAVGVVDRYDAFIDRLNEHFGLRFKPTHENRGGLLKDIQAKRVGSELRRRIEQLNGRDMALYSEALELPQRPSR